MKSSLAQGQSRAFAGQSGLGQKSTCAISPGLSSALGSLLVSKSMVAVCSSVPQEGQFLGAAAVTS